MPVVDPAWTGNAENPGPTIDINRVRCKAATRERIVIMGIIHLDIACAHGCAIEWGMWIGVGIGIKATNDFTRIRRLRPDPGAYAHRESRLHQKMNTDGGRDTQCQETTPVPRAI